MAIECRLIVLRTPDMEKLSAFYSMVGMHFDPHQHDTGPLHYTSVVGSVIVEIYPLAKGQPEADKNLRLGFTIDDFENIVALLQANKFSFQISPQQTEFGFMTVVTDPDGRKVELYKKGIEPYQPKKQGPFDQSL